MNTRSSKEVPSWETPLKTYVESLKRGEEAAKEFVSQISDQDKKKLAKESAAIKAVVSTVTDSESSQNRWITDVRNILDTRPSENAGPIAFCIGVSNLVLTTWILARFPHCYWIYYCIKNLALLIARYFVFKKRKEVWYMLEFCYLTNYLSIFYFVICVAKRHIPALAFLREFDYLGYYLFRVAFTWVNGPLAMSIAKFNNAIVFHSVMHIGITAVHIGPALALWGLRWFNDDLEAFFPDTFHINVNQTAATETWQELFKTLLINPIILYIFLWAIPFYLADFVIFREKIHKSQEHIMFEDVFEKEIDKLLTSFGGWLHKNIGLPFLDHIYEIFTVRGKKYSHPFVYMCMHFIASSFTFTFSQVFWRSFWLHTLYLVVLIHIAIFNGATWYFKIFERDFAKKRYAKILASDEEVSGGQAAGGDTRLRKRK